MRSQRSRAFTLVELLVVVAIIAVLIAILLPVLSRARRAAAVLASPIAYTGADGMVHLTDPGGGMDVEIAGRSSVSCPVCHSPPQWSPSGQTLAFYYSNSPNTRQPGVLGFVQPVPNRVKSYTDGRFLFAWADSDSVLEGTVSGPLEIWGASTHRLQTQLTSAVKVYSIAATPTGNAAPYVGIYAAPALEGWIAVGFLKRDLSPGRTVWMVQGSRAVNDMQRPRADPLGESIAWTQRSGGQMKIAVKDVRDPASVVPTLIGAPFRSAYFCDWAENGNLLGNVSDDFQRWSLAIFDRKGRLMKKLDMSAAPAEGVVASWRKYGHR